MPAGLEVFNDEGKLQLSASFMQYYLKKKGQFILATEISGGGSGEFQTPPRGQRTWGVFDLAAENPYPDQGYAVDPDKGYIVAYASDQPIFNTALDANGVLFPLSHVQNAVVTYYVFAPFKEYEPPASGYGLQVFNEAGELVFDASAKPLIKLAKFNLSSMYANMDQALGMPGNRSYAVFINTPSVRQVTPFVGYSSQGFYNQYNCNETAFRIANGDVRVSESNRTVFGVGDKFVGSLTVIDVTNY